jgi:hypothetical protein
VILNLGAEARFSNVAPMELEWMTTIPAMRSRPTSSPMRLVSPTTAAAMALRLTSAAPTPYTHSEK